MLMHLKSVCDIPCNAIPHSHNSFIQCTMLLTPAVKPQSKIILAHLYPRRIEKCFSSSFSSFMSGLIMWSSLLMDLVKTIVLQLEKGKKAVHSRDPIKELGK